MAIVFPQNFRWMLVSGWAMLCVLLPFYFIRSAVGEKIVRLFQSEEYGGRCGD